MQKYKLALILYSSAIGVFYGVTTASAAPLRNWAHDFVVQSATAVAQFVASSRDFDSKSSASIPTDPVIFTSGVVDTIAAFERENQLEYPASAALIAADNAARDVFGQHFGGNVFNSDNQSFAATINQSVSSNARNDNPGRFVYQNGDVFRRGSKPNRPQPEDVVTIAGLDTPTPIFEDIGGNLPENHKYPDEYTWPVPPVLKINSDTPSIGAESDPSRSPTTTSFVAVQTIPETATLALLGLGIAGLSFIRRRPA